MHLTLISVLLHAVGSHVGRHERRKPSVCVCSVMWVVAQVFMPAAPFAALCLLASPWTPAPVDVFLSVATFLTCMSQQFHAWAHMKKSELPAVVDRLQVQQMHAC